MSHSAMFFLMAEFLRGSIFFFVKSVLVFLLHVSSLKYGLKQVLTHLAVKVDKIHNSLTEN